MGSPKKLWRDNAEKRRCSDSTVQGHLGNQGVSGLCLFKSISARYQRRCSHPKITIEDAEVIAALSTH